MFLEDPNVSYMIASSNDIVALNSYMYSRNYNVIDIKGFYEGKFENSMIAVSNVDNNELRMDAIHIMDHFDQESVIVKYHGETNAKKVFSNGEEKPMGVVMYNTDAKNRSYILNELSFAFVEKQSYFRPKSVSDLRVGMIVEYLSGDKWLQRRVVNPEREYDKMYKLLIKYDKVRIPKNKSLLI